MACEWGCYESDVVPDRQSTAPFQSCRDQNGPPPLRIMAALLNQVTFRALWDINILLLDFLGGTIRSHHPRGLPSNPESLRWQPNFFPVFELLRTFLSCTDTYQAYATMIPAPLVHSWLTHEALLV